MRRGSFFWMGVLLGSWALWVGGRATAQEVKIAVVDMGAVGDQYKELNARQAELGAWVQEKRNYLTALQDFMFVSAEEFQEVARIYQTPKEQWSEEQKKREAELRKVSEANERKFLDLQAKPARTAEEQNLYGTLRDTFQARDRDLKALSAEFDKQLKQKREELQGRLGANVRSAIEQVAKAQGLQLVLDKSAVLFVATPVQDITEEVLKTLNAAGSGAAGGANATPAQPQP